VSRIVDLLFVGGGINGAAITRDAAGRGIATYLAKKRHYVSGASSASSKLIHGGLRYLEHGEFRLVRQSLREREVLLRLVPHLVRPLRFLVPITRGQSKPAWMMRTGLWLYDQLAARRALAPSGRLRTPEAKAFPRLRRQYLRAVRHYPDCWRDDARLTLACQLDARDRGADPLDFPKRWWPLCLQSNSNTHSKPKTRATRRISCIVAPSSSSNSIRRRASASLVGSASGRVTPHKLGDWHECHRSAD